ncbi:MAG TPA: tetratricopeptide repeat protein [Syntrophales bacterium]|nr:tetratricopeptide repeat protein [Syntrophales bacterium]
MINLKIIKYAAITVYIVAVTAACATSPWKQEQADSHMNIGVAYLGSNRYNDALKEFLEAENLSPRDPQVHYYLGIAYREKKLNDKAIVEFKKALALKPDYSEAHNNLGSIYLSMGLWDDALDAFKKALSNMLYETPDKALFNMGLAYYGKGEYQKALNTFQEVRNRQPHTIPESILDFHMGITYYEQGNLEKAVQYFKTSLTGAPAFLEAQSRYWLGQTYIKMHHREKAKAEFKAVIKISPESDLGKAARKNLDSLR